MNRCNMAVYTIFAQTNIDATRLHIATEQKKDRLKLGIAIYMKLWYIDYSKRFLLCL